MIGGKPAASARPRPGGGMNPGMGDFGEHLDEAAMAQAAKQQALTQQSSSAKPSANTGSSLSHNNYTNLTSLDPKELTNELVLKPAKDIGKSFIDGLIQASGLSYLGLDFHKEPDPEEKARLQQIASRYKALNEEQQAVARQIYEQNLQRQQQEEAERQQKKQMEEEAQAASLVVPSTPQKGPIGPAGNSSKQRAITKLNNDRQRLGGPGGAN